MIWGPYFRKPPYDYPMIGGFETPMFNWMDSGNMEMWPSTWDVVIGSKMSPLTHEQLKKNTENSKVWIAVWLSYDSYDSYDDSPASSRAGHKKPASRAAPKIMKLHIRRASKKSYALLRNCMVIIMLFTSFPVSSVYEKVYGKRGVHEHQPVDDHFWIPNRLSQKDWKPRLDAL